MSCAHSLSPHCGEVWAQPVAFMGIGLLCRAGLRQPQSALGPAWEGKSGATPPKPRRRNDLEIREVPPPDDLTRTPFRLKAVLRAQRSEHRFQAEPESAGLVPTHDLPRTPFRLKLVLRAQRSEHRL